MSDLFDTVISDVGADRPAYRQAPAGDYLAIVQSAKEVKANSGTRGIELNFTLREYFGTGDMDGVDLAKARARDTQWVTEKTVEYVKERFARINPETVGGTFRDALDVLPGSEVVLSISHETKNRDGSELRTPRLKIDRYYSVEWYDNNKKAA